MGLAAVQRVGAGREGLTLLAAVGRAARLLAVDLHTHWLCTVTSYTVCIVFIHGIFAAVSRGAAGLLAVDQHKHTHTHTLAGFTNLSAR